MSVLNWRPGRLVLHQLPALELHPTVRNSSTKCVGGSTIVLLQDIPNSDLSL